MVRFGRGFPQSTSQHLFGALDFVQLIVDLGPSGHQELTVTLRDLASVDVVDAEQSTIDILRVGPMTVTLRPFVIDIQEDFELTRQSMTVTLRPLTTISISPTSGDSGTPGWEKRKKDRKKEKTRDHPWNRLQYFPDTTGQPGVDFAPIVSQFGFWRVSETLRDSIRLRETTTISEDLTIEGKP